MDSISKIVYMCYTTCHSTITNKLSIKDLFNNVASLLALQIHGNRMEFSKLFTAFHNNNNFIYPDKTDQLIKRFAGINR